MPHGPKSPSMMCFLVNHDATLDEIKQAFKRRALQVHPDKGGSKEQFHAVYQALEILFDQEARKRYDFRLKSGGPPSTGQKESGKYQCHMCYTTFQTCQEQHQRIWVRGVETVASRVAKDFESNP